MLVTVFCAPRDRPEITFSLDVSPDLELRDFVALCELESGIPATDIQISYAEQPLQDPTRALGMYGLKDGDVVVLRQAERRPPPQPSFPGIPHIDFSSIAVPGTSSARRPTSQQQKPTQNTPQTSQQGQQQQEQSPLPPPPPSLGGSASSPQGLDDPSLLREMLLANPHELSLLKERNPPLAEALLSGDLERFTKVLLEQQQERARREQERIRLLTADPFDLEAQAKIEEDIRQHNIEENMTIAMEEAPESFGQVVMLYINCKVNGHPVKAFVDSGAQMTIMSQACAERCNIMRLVDRRWAGIAKGVGTQKIIGRVHLAQVQIEGDFLACSFSILEDQPMDMLLGLDMLKRHQCSIDLKKSVLLIGTTGSETRFLPEAELPECARLAYGAEGREDTRPEEIADRELAEALQRSVQESDPEDGQTTSPPVQTRPLSPHSAKTSLVSSPTPTCTPNPTLDRSQSAPACLPHTPPQVVTASGPSQSDHPSQGLNAPPPPIPVTLHNPDLEALPLDPPPPPADPSPPHLPTPAPLDPLFTSAPKVSVSTENSEGLAPTAMEVGLVAGADGAGSSVLPPLPHAGASPPQMRQDLGELRATDAKNMSASISGEQEEVEEEERYWVGRDRECGEHPCMAPLDPALQLNPGLHEENLASEPIPGSEASSVDLPMETAINPQAAPQAERDQPEGEQQPNCDSIPSLAAALKELHQLLVVNKHMLSQERSPTPSPSPSPSCREDADGVDDSPVLQSKPAALEDAQSAAAPTAEAIAAEPEGAPPPLVTTLCTSDALDHEESSDRGAAGAPGLAKVWGVAVVDGELMENMERRSEADPDGPPPPRQDLALREPPEGQQGRGVADGQAYAANAPDPAPSPMEVAPPIALPTTVNASCPAPALPVEDSCIPPHVPRPLSSSPVPCQSSASPQPSLPSDHRFPTAHIQKIQAAGFSASEAAEALEQVQGHVELALLMLLARKITVPT